MKLADILDKKVLYFRDTDCNYYWDYKYVVDIDKDNVALINHGGSHSGWVTEDAEFVDREFITCFFENRWNGKMDSFEVVKNATLGEYGIRETNEDGDNLWELEVILLDKLEVQKVYNDYKKLLKEANNE